MNRLVLISMAVAAVGILTEVTSAKRYPSRNGGKKMVCYVGTWAVYRPGDGKFEMEDIDPNLCTHIMYGFTKLENNEITVFDPWGDLGPNNGGGKDMYKRFTDLRQKNPNLKALIAIGGWNEGSTKYSEMARNPSSRRTFVKSIVPFLQKYQFDGLDLDWEYPTQRGGEPEDKENFSELVKELRQELGNNYLLTAAVSPNTKTVEIAYEVPVISQYLDFINVMCYDYHGYWEGHEFTGHNTPLYKHPLDDQFEPLFNANDTVQYWLRAGLPKEKLVMGMALYGRGFTLAKEDDHGLYAPISGGIPMGPYTRQDGTWGYNEICEKYMTEMSQWRITIDSRIKAPYAYNGRNWIGYEDAESLYYKAKYVKDMDLAGAMVWSLETDDFRGKCHGEKYILLKTIVNTLNGGGMPQIPERPQVVPSEDEDYDNVVEVDTPKPTTRPRPTRPSNNRRTTTLAENSDEFLYTTTRRPRPGQGGQTNDEYTTSRRPRPGAGRPTQVPDDDDDYTTTRRHNKPGGGSGSGSNSQTSKPVPRPPPTDDNDDDDYTTTRRSTKPKPGSGSGGSSNNNNNNNNHQGGGGGSHNGECTREGLIPGPDCSTFYQCVRAGNGYRKFQQRCPAGTAFNPDIQACDHADAVQGCGGKVKTSFSFRSMGHQ